jgi:hypothetical protein
VISRFTWQVTAAGTAACYEAVLEGRLLPGAPLIAPLPMESDEPKREAVC